ncbi:MAG: Glu/Leu/Phe/Val dehydrogenase [Pirellula sp.]
MQNHFEFDDLCDNLGPEQIIHIHEPSCGLKAIVVVDNTACGPSIGGIRMASDVSTNEVFRLARAMTLKNASAGLPHGGGKAGIVADPKTADKSKLILAFARAIRNLTSYIPGPDMGTDERCMALIHNEIGRSVGLPSVLGGIPLDKIGATGFGIAQCAEIAAEHCGLDLKGARVAVEGFGNVGRPAASFLSKLGTKLVAASDTQGTLFDSSGINIDQLIEIKERGGSVVDMGKGEKLTNQAVFSVDCDILIPAARPDVINAENAHSIKARVMLQGANIPATAQAETILHQRGVLVVPDFIANAGGVICASVEYHQGSQSVAFTQIAEKIRRNTREVLTRSRDAGIEPRQAAVDMARERVVEAMSYRCQG